MRLTTPITRARPLAFLIALVLALGVLAGCKERPPKVPGETDIHVEAVAIVGPEGHPELALPHDELFDRLGMRKDSLIRTERTYSAFREAEDRRRIEAYWQSHGYFDVAVAEAKTSFSDDRERVRVTYVVRENERYALADVVFRSAPPDEVEALKRIAGLEPGVDAVDLDRFRVLRNDMADFLRRRGYGHANVYLRSYVEKATRKVSVHFFVDAGPRTTIGSVRVDGNVKIPTDDVLDRAGLEIGAPYTEDLRDRVVRDLLDTGAFNAAFVRVDTDTKFIPPGTTPDTGGELRDEQVDANGELVPRKLPAAVNMTIHVVEAPSETVRLRAGFEIDPTRADASIGLATFARNAFGPLHHLAFEGRLAYGFLFGDDVSAFDPESEPSGVYGNAKVQATFASALGRLGDLRITAQVRSELFPGFYLHEVEGGPGVRTTLDKGLFIDVDLLARYAYAPGFGPFTEAERDAFRLPDQLDAYGPVLAAGITWDGRDNPVEAMKGHLLALAAEFSPGLPIATHRYLRLAPDARLFLPFTPKLALGLRAQAKWSLLSDDEGLPLGARLFGGGPYGVRGFGRDRLSPELARCLGGGGLLCDVEPVGGVSLFESGVELRFLPPREPYGAIAFVDLGGASPNENPFEDGLALALGLGARLRLWYIPIAIDVSYALLRQSEIQGIDDAPILVFFRIGEAF